VSGSTVYAGGAFDMIGGQFRNRIAALDAVTGNATSWNPNASAWVYALAVSGSKVCAGGEFTGIGGQTRNYIAALDAVTGNATSWDPNASHYVRGLAVSGSIVYACGSFYNIGGQARIGIAALDAVTGNATSWDANIPEDSFTAVKALVVSSSTVYAGGNFGSIGGQMRPGIAALDAVTGNATSWNPNASAPFGPDVYALAVSVPTVYAGGTFTGIGGQPRPYFAAIGTQTRTHALALDSGPKDLPIDAADAQRSLIRVGPNPASGPVQIEYSLAREADVRVQVFDVMGCEIARLMDGVDRAGSHQVMWDGEGRAGRVSSGVYFVRFESAGKSTTRRLVLLR
jgi:hypothetical protein